MMDKRALDAYLSGSDEALLDDDEVLECLESGNTDDPCEGDVDLYMRDDMKSFPRCRHHGERWLDRQSHARELMSPIPASWFDPLAAGEVWDDDY